MAHTLSTDCDTAFRVSLNVHSLHLTDEQFYLLCRDNSELRLELSAEDELIIMPPAYSETGWKEAKVVQRLANWTEKDGTGRCYGPTAGFTLPNGARLGWLLDPIEKRVYIYRARRPVECLENPHNLSGEDVLPGFRFNFQEILSDDATEESR